MSEFRFLFPSTQGRRESPFAPCVPEDTRDVIWMQKVCRLQNLLCSSSGLSPFSWPFRKTQACRLLQQLTAPARGASKAGILTAGPGLSQGSVSYTRREAALTLLCKGPRLSQERDHCVHPLGTGRENWKCKKSVFIKIVSI